MVGKPAQLVWKEGGKGRQIENILRCPEGQSDSPAVFQERNKHAAQELATLLLSLPAPVSVQQQSKSLLASLHTSRSAYHSHKVTVPSLGGLL